MLNSWSYVVSESNKTITVTPINGIPRMIDIESIKEIKHLKDFYHCQTDPNDPSKSVIVIEGYLTDEQIKVDETVEEIKAMIDPGV